MLQNKFLFQTPWFQPFQPFVKLLYAKFYVSKTSVLDWDFNKLIVTNGTRNVTLITQAQLEASYSKNNDLSSLSVEGYELSPLFNKDTIAYSVNVPSTVTSIKVNAKKADSTASVAGVGEFPISEGLNTFEVKVTAQNGNVKTYTLNVNVEDMNPILVTIDGKEYTVIKRKDLLTSPATFQDATVIINETEIPAFTSEVLKYNLVGLKDAEGNIKLHIYNEGTYTPYIELSLNNVVLNPVKYDKKIDGYEKTTILINGVETEVYKLNSKSDFAIVYGKNVESGEEGLYLFDTKENTLQRYYSDEVVKLKKEIKEYTIILFGFAGALVLSIGYIVYTIIKGANKKDKKVNKKDKKQKEEEKIEE